jgi:hypothetical protein
VRAGLRDLYLISDDGDDGDAEGGGTTGGGDGAAGGNGVTAQDRQKREREEVEVKALKMERHIPSARSYNAGRAGLVVRVVDGGLCTRRAVMVWCFCFWWPNFVSRS